MQYKKKVLPNGLRIIFEEIPYVQSVSIGVWIAAGARNEQPEVNGISHFIEHMAFKGTKRRSARAIAEEIDNVGGQLNAFTGKECTCYYAKVLNRQMELAFDILSDMLFDSKFSQSEIDKEKNVVFEEISMYEDSPEEIIHDIYASNVFRGHPLGYPVLGDINTVKGIDRKDILAFLKANYRPDNTVISVAGNVKQKDIERLAAKYFSDWGEKSPVTADSDRPVLKFEYNVKQKDTEQVHFCMGFKGLNQKDEKLYSFLALNNLLGGGMSSRLFQRVREELGLVYSIYVYPATYSDVGLMTVYAGTNPAQLEKVIQTILGELKDLKKNGIRKEELLRVKEQMKGNYILGMEGTGSRMSSMGKSELLLGKIFSQQETLKNIDLVDMEDLREMIDYVIDFQNIAITVLGSADEKIKELQGMIV
ncbi:MAG: pitrilysin family protein [Bacillota bacterium]|nr:pitrilysin family protein [Bacillota bacterium]MDD3297284.1 pitrilysin family protein [Bacillota bacterium]MDD3850452.1 pitrilysin family protein [Bacillota bacterium]MDD4706800.1 pitrilysin family protein [Bacillota bacterium]